MATGVNATQTKPHTAPDASPLRIHNFRAYLLARFSMIVGQYAMMLIIGWQTYTIARGNGLNAFEASGQLAMIGLLQFLPLFVLAPFSGLAADRFNRKTVSRLTILLQLLCAAFLAWMTYTDHIELTSLFAVAVLLGVVRAFNGPALSALAPNLVPKAILPNAIALSSIAWQTGMIVGPAVGGYAYDAMPPCPMRSPAGCS